MNKLLALFVTTLFIVPFLALPSDALAACTCPTGFQPNATQSQCVKGAEVRPCNGIAISLTPPPNLGINPALSLSTLFSNVVTIVFIVAAIAVLIMLFWGGFMWITSGGEKEAVGKARQRIIAALVGLAILALAFLIVNIVGRIINIDIFRFTTIPTLQSTPAP